MNRVLARRLTLSAPRAGGLTKRVIPGFNTSWEHPSAVSTLLYSPDFHPKSGPVSYSWYVYRHLREVNFVVLIHPEHLILSYIGDFAFWRRFE